MKDWLRNIFKDKKGMGTVEVILIICRNIYPLIHAIYYVDTVEIVEIEKQYKQECV